MDGPQEKPRTLTLSSFASNPFSICSRRHRTPPPVPRGGRFSLCWPLAAAMSSFLDSIEPRRREQLLQLAASRLQAAPPPPPPAAGQLAAADAARLRVRAHTLAEENGSLRRNLQAMVAQAKRSEAELQVGGSCLLLLTPADLPPTCLRLFHALRHRYPHLPLRRRCGAQRPPSSSARSSSMPPRRRY